MQMRNTTGFTLVELLVVIAIISILAGLLLPVLEDALAAARTTECVGNKRQTMLATQMYADDNNGWTYIYSSLYHYGNTVSPYMYFWEKLVGGQYLSSDATGNYGVDNCPVMYCPMSFTDSGGNRNAHAMRYQNTYYYLHGARVGQRKPDGTTPIPYELKPLEYLPYTHSEFIFFGEARGAGGTLRWFYNSGGYSFNLRHNDMATVAFADGHGGTVGEGELADYGITAWWVGADGLPTE